MRLRKREAARAEQAGGAAYDAGAAASAEVSMLLLPMGVFSVAADASG